MTPYESKIIKEEKRNQATILAWSVAALSRQNRLPALKSLLGDSLKTDKKTMEINLKQALSNVGGKK